MRGQRQGFPKASHAKVESKTGNYGSGGLVLDIGLGGVTAAPGIWTLLVVSPRGQYRTPGCLSSLNDQCEGWTWLKMEQMIKNVNKR